MFFLVSAVVLSTSTFADMVFQLDVGIGPGLSLVDTDFQVSWYGSNVPIGVGTHLNTYLGIAEELGVDFVIGTKSNKQLHSIGVGGLFGYFIPVGVIATYSYQYAFGSKDHRFALKPSISLGYLINDTLTYEVALFLNYSYNNGEKR